MNLYVVRVIKPGDIVERFVASIEHERFDAEINAHGDLTVSRYNHGDPYQTRYPVALLAAGQWLRADVGWEEIA